MKRSRQRTVAGTVVAFATALAVSACGEDSTTTTTSDKVTLLLPAPRGVAWTPIIVAEEKGWVKDEGISIDIQAQTASGVTVQQLIAGNVDFIGASAAEAVVAYAADKRLRVVFCSTPRNVFRIVAPADGDVKSVADLAGKNVGVSEAAGGEVPIVEAALSGEGLDKNTDYKMLPVGGGGATTVRSITDGKVAAYASSFFDIAAVQASGLGVIDITPENVEGIPGPCLMTTDEALKDPVKREVAEKVARVWSKGVIYSEIAPDAALDFVCETVARECEDRDFTKLALTELLKVSDRYVPGEDFPGTPETTGFKIAGDILTQTGVLESPVDTNPMAGSPEVLEFNKSWPTFDPEEIVALANADAKK